MFSMYLDDAPQEGVLEIDYKLLSSEALDGVLEEFISREGTDYGEQYYSLEDKKAQVLKQLADKSAVLLFDPINQQCHIEVQARLTQAGFFKHQSDSL